MSATEPSGNDNVELSEDHRMLLRIRDTLYEGSWEDFMRDLQARAEDRPHVFETVPASPQMKQTIESHVAMIHEMQTWEDRHQRTLSADGQVDCSSSGR